MAKTVRTTLTIGRLSVDVLDFPGAVRRIVDLAREHRAAYVVTPNADHVVRAQTDAEFVAIAQGADLSVADGMPLVWASRFLGQRLPQRVTGADLLPAICAEAAKQRMTVYLFGGLPGEAELASQRLEASCPGLLVVGCYCPPFGFEHNQELCQQIVSQINAVHPDFVFVGVGSPKQELWIARWRSELRCGVLLGVGIAIAFVAGTVRRAPRWMQVTGTEWLFRLVSEPRRLLRRYLHDVTFVAIVWRQMRRKH
ncbi:MAG: WecB/TagA/CpsF family glycosyltransferase [Proteobacteria bacterium]|nr:WecB/TagA/CpsF family glycosyltransferase [Pseudomonadota bacterium]